MSKLDQFKGNILTKEEKEYRMSRLIKTVQDDNFDMAIDLELVPYLRRINSFPFIMTTQSCTGHNGDNGRKAHFDFRSMLSEKDTIDLLLRPVSEFEGVSIELMLEADKCRYCLWLDNNKWKKQIKFFVSLLETISKELIK